MADFILTCLWVFFVEICLVGTGHCVLFVLSLGRLNKFISSKTPNQAYFISLMTGACFWIAVAFLIEAVTSD